MSVPWAGLCCEHRTLLLLVSESAQWRKVEQPWNWQLDSIGQFHDYVCVPCEHWIEQHSCLLAYCASPSQGLAWVGLSSLFRAHSHVFVLGPKHTVCVYDWSALFYVWKSVLMSFSVLAPLCGYCEISFYVFTIGLSMFTLIASMYVSWLFFGLLPDFNMYYSPISLTFLPRTLQCPEPSNSSCHSAASRQPLTQWLEGIIQRSSVHSPTLPCQQHDNAHIIVTL